MKMDNVNKPLVSIVMAAYNEERFIQYAIESIINQTYENFEFIIINDGSTDRTEEIISSFQDTRIVYLKNENNLGLISSLNKGLKSAKGKYIARMDSDDISENHRLEKQIEFMENNPKIGICGSNLRIFGAENGKMKYPLAHEEIRLRLFITSPFGNNVVCFRKELLINNNLYFPDGYLHAEDFKSWCNWIMVTSGANLDMELVHYRSHSNSVSNKNKELQRQTRNRIRSEYVLANFDVKHQRASHFAGKVSLKKMAAMQVLLKKNENQKKFDHEKLKQTFIELWYLDSLEQVEYNFFVILRFVYVFRISPTENFKKWLYVLKHYIKCNFFN